MTKEYILNFLKTNKQLLNDKYNVTKIGLFGSYAKDMANENSDIDLAIVSTKKDFVRIPKSYRSLVNTLEGEIVFENEDLIKEILTNVIENHLQNEK